MTIHSVLRVPVTDTDALLDAVGNATSMQGIAALLEVLGLRADLRELHLPERAGSSIAERWSLAERGTLRVLFLGMRCAITPPVVLDASRILRRIEPARPLLIVIADDRFRSLTFACFDPAGQLRHLTFEPTSPVAADIEVLRDMIAAPDEPGVALAMRYVAALDNKVVGARFFAEVRVQRNAIAAAWEGLPRNAESERDQLALLLICRLVFLYFLQRNGHLAGEPNFMRARVAASLRDGVKNAGIFRSFLVPLFFGSLNTRPESRAEDARALGALPYLNGGLFERSPLERRFADLDLPDTIVTNIFDSLLDKFRFTSTDAAEASPDVQGTHIDPEMLGRVFEGLMTADRRGDTGTFYTPPQMVDVLTRRTLVTHLAGAANVPFIDVKKLIDDGDTRELTYTQRSSLTKSLREVRVLDPACGSGAFLLGALSRISAGRAAIGEDPVAARRDIVARCLHGVDLLDDAALLCSLRLWLALADSGTETPAPLPNLDRRIRQGDALLDPIELIAPRAGTGTDALAIRDRVVRAAARNLTPLTDRYLDAEPDERLRLREEIKVAEYSLAKAWATSLEKRQQRDLRDAQARAAARDLWGDATTSARIAERDVVQVARRMKETVELLRRMDDAAMLPFFSFRIHFADQPSFNVVLSNPPWVRAHRWPAAVGAAVRDRYEVCRTAGWAAASEHGSRSGGQVDLAILFLERALGLLAAGGTLGMLLPAKVIRSLYAGGARSLLCRSARIASIEDHALDQRSVFRADAFTAAVVARKNAAETPVVGEKKKTASSAEPRKTISGESACDRVHVRMIRRGVPPLEFDLHQNDLPLIPGDGSAPWLLAPPGVIAAMRKMQRAGPCLAQTAMLSVSRGIVTGANDILVVREFAHKLGGLSHIRAEGYFRARQLSRSTAESRKFVGYIETSSLRPLLRGTDVQPWQWSSPARLVWTRHITPRNRASYPRLCKYLARHEAALRERSGVAAGAPIGAVMRVSDATLGHKVVWRDIGTTLHAAAVPDLVAGDYGGRVPVIPLNTVYFVAVPDPRTALLLSAYLNSSPVRTFARACAERAKDAHFRFFAWTVGTLPLPSNWRGQYADELCDVAHRAHEEKGIDAAGQARLDALVARAYGLAESDITALRVFDCWLSGDA